jgi:ribosomal-protein-alanine N-acetyltransferase
MFELGPLSESDLDEVVEIEKLCFGTPWNRGLFSNELAQSEICFWTKATHRTGAPGASTHRVAGYMGFWKAVDEAHITNMAVRPEYRRQGLARTLAQSVLKQARELGCVRATLEVRPSNLAALSLYESLGFTGVALRPRYYVDNEEDALIMWKNGL